MAAALADFAAKYNERNPGKEVLYLNYAAVDPVLTNDKCTFAHFRWDANSDVKMAALTNFMKDRQAIKKVYLINQDYSFGQSVRAQAVAMLKVKRPDVQIVGDELHPLLKITDFAPYIAKIKASGADTVITGNWGQDMSLLFKAAADAGLKVDWYTYYAGGAGGPTAIKQTGLNDRVFAIVEGHANVPNAAAEKIETDFRAKTGLGVWYPRAFNQMTMLVEAIKQAGDVDAKKVGAKLEGMKVTTYTGEPGVHARRRPPVLPGHVHRQLRAAARGRQVRRGEDRLGLDDGRQGRGQGHGPADHLQDGPSVTPAR